MRYDLGAKLQHIGLASQLDTFGPQFEMPSKPASKPASQREYDGTLDYNEARSSQPVASQHASNTPESTELLNTSADPVVPMTAADAIKAYVLGGRSTFTIQGKTARYTWKVSHKPASDHGRECYFVALLTGPDNTADFTYAGILLVQTGELRLTRASKYQASSPCVLAWQWYMTRVWAGHVPTTAQFYHLGRCGRCGRALTVPSSIECGFGPECAGKI